MRMLLLAGAAVFAMTGMAGAAVQTGYVAITDASTAASLGWVSRTPNPYGEYVVTTDTANRLQVSYDDASAPFPIQILDSGAGSYHWLSAIQGFGNTDANLGVGSSNYAVLGNASLTAPGATPALQDNIFTDSTGIPSATESSIWSLPGTGSPLEAQWVNTDGSLTGTTTLLTDGLLVLTGDAAAFTDQYGPAILALLTLVPLEPSSTPSPVPAPASLPVLGSGLLGLFMARHRA